MSSVNTYPGQARRRVSKRLRQLGENKYIPSTAIVILGWSLLFTNVQISATRLGALRY